MESIPKPTILESSASMSCLLLWLIAYVLIIRRGFKDQTFGMPLTAICANVSWEGLLAFVFAQPNPTAAKVYLLWFAADLVILFTGLKYGRREFPHPFIQRWFYLIMAFGIAMFTAGTWAFMKVYNDNYGQVTGWIYDIPIGTLLIAMLLRRRSVKGQSIYIAACIWLANVVAYYLTLSYPMPPPPLPMLLIHVIFACVLVLNSTYLGFLGLLWQQCKQEGINPLRRF
jgi:hypothetical protein